MRSFHNHTGINLTTAKMQLVEINFTGDEFVLENVDEDYFGEFLNFEDKETKIVNYLQNAFNEIIMRKPLKSKYVSFTLPHEFFYTVQIPFEHTLIHQDLIDHFHWELSVLYPEVLSDDLAVQYAGLERFNDSYSKALVVAIPKRFLKMLHNFCAQNSLKLKYVDNLHIASDNIIAFDHSLLDNDIVLSLYISPEYYSLNVIQNSRPMYFNMTKLDNAGEVVPLLKEELKRKEFGNFRNIIKSVISGENIPDSFLLRAKNELNINFERLNPFDKLKVNSDLTGKKFLAERAYSFSSAAGIAFRIV